MALFICHWGAHFLSTICYIFILPKTLQDEMTEYLRARRLSQAEIEKLYAVENFYEYIQNYLLHHKDVFNYPYQKCADSILYPED